MWVLHRDFKQCNILQHDLLLAIVLLNNQTLLPLVVVAGGKRRTNEHGATAEGELKRVVIQTYHFNIVMQVAVKHSGLTVYRRLFHD